MNLKPKFSMKYRILLCCCLLACALGNVELAAQTSPIQPIPDSLKENANAVILFHNTTIDLTNDGILKQKVHFAVRVLNSAGKSHAYLTVHYNKGDKVHIRTVKFFNSKGILEKGINKGDIHDYSAYDGFSIFSDNRVKSVRAQGTQYPYTAEFAYEIEQNGYVHIDTWCPVYTTQLAAKSATLSVVYKDLENFRVKALNYPFKQEKNYQDKLHTTSWSVKGIKASRDLPFLPTRIEMFPAVILAPKSFSFEGYAGSLESWKSYGKWVNNLLMDRAVLPPETIQEITALTANMVSDYDKAKTVYEYMQNRTRYVSIQLGIGGFQPMYATDVENYGYGDCKALSNYTMALLKAVGVRAYYTEIGAGNDQKIRFPNFVSLDQTNHVILTLPLESDTVFMECTSQTVPFGYLGVSSANRTALMISPEGGQLIKTPTYSPEDNFMNRSMELNIAADGSATCEANEKYGCGQYDYNIARLLRLSEKEQRKHLLEQLEMNKATLGKFSVSQRKGRKPTGCLKMEVSSSKYAAVMGSRLIFHMNPNYDGFHLLPKVENRKMDIVRNVGYVDTDTVYIAYPKGYGAEFLPENFSASTPFGEYQYALTQIDDAHLQYTRRLKMVDGRFDKSRYPELVAFYNLVAEKDKQKVVLKKLE